MSSESSSVGSAINEVPGLVRRCRARMSRLRHRDRNSSSIMRGCRSLVPLLIASLLLATVTTSSAAAVASSSASPVAAGDELVLRYGQAAPPNSLDPARSGGEDTVFHSLAYAPLINAATDGSYQPGLAESWTELAGDNTKFELTLREGVVFSDGEPLNADAVQANIEYYIEAAGQSSGTLSAISEIEIVDDLTLRLTFTDPQPLFTQLFSQGGSSAGMMISPAAIADPESMATETFGAGPYLLASDESVLNDTYVYLPNPDYWDPDGIHWDRVEVKVLPDQNAMVAALTTGQVDVITSGPEVIEAVEATDGLAVTATPVGIVLGVQLNDREGTLSEPLAEVRVRQALNYAVDRETITAAVIGDYGIPTEQPAAPGTPWYSDTNFYTYDPDKARELLAEAGYPDGFTFEAVTTAQSTVLLEAIAANLEEVGVTMEIAVVEGAAFFDSIDDYPASIMGWGASPPHSMGRALWLRGATGMNPFDSSDPVVEDLDQQALGADEETQVELYRQMIQQLVEQAWFLPVAFQPIFYYHSDTVNIPVQQGGGFPTVDTWRPAS